MLSLRELRRKIISIKNIQQITRSMKLVASARLVKAQKSIISARPFADKLRELIASLVNSLYRSNMSVLPDQILSNRKISCFMTQYKSNKIAVILITADKGLCGSFNNQIIRKTLEFIKEKKENVLMLTVGKKGRDFFRNYKLNVVKEYVDIFRKIGFVHAEIIGKDIMDIYEQEKLKSVYLIYNEFKSVIRQKIVIEKLIPVTFFSEDRKPDRPNIGLEGMDNNLRRGKLYF